MSVQQMFKRAMLSSLGEYISVRDNAKLLRKIESGEKSDCTVTTRTFSAGKGFVVKYHKGIISEMGSKKSEIHTDGKSWICECVKKI